MLLPASHVEEFLRTKLSLLEERSSWAPVVAGMLVNTAPAERRRLADIYNRTVTAMGQGSTGIRIDDLLLVPQSLADSDDIIYVPITCSYTGARACENGAHALSLLGINASEPWLRDLREAIGDYVRAKSRLPGPDPAQRPDQRPELAVGVYPYVDCLMAAAAIWLCRETANGSVPIRFLESQWTEVLRDVKPVGSYTDPAYFARDVLCGSYGSMRDSSIFRFFPWKDSTTDLPAGVNVGLAPPTGTILHVKNFVGFYGETAAIHQVSLESLVGGGFKPAVSEAMATRYDDEARTIAALAANPNHQPVIFSNLGYLWAREAGLIKLDSNALRPEVGSIRRIRVEQKEGDPIGCGVRVLEKDTGPASAALFAALRDACTELRIRLARMIAQPGPRSLDPWRDAYSILLAPVEAADDEQLDGFLYRVPPQLAVSSAFALPSGAEFQRFKAEWLFEKENTYTPAWETDLVLAVQRMAQSSAACVSVQSAAT